jgi:hypothetical protein
MYVPYLLMAALSLSIDAIRPLNRWNYERIQPGVVGSIGDPLLQSRLKHTQPDAPIIWEAGTVGKPAIMHGSNVNDGSQKSYFNNGAGAKVVDSNWGSGRDFKTTLGYIYQDLRATDRSVIPLMGPTPDYSWNNKVATAYRANITGEKFLPLPNGYAPQGQQLRGGNFPIVTSGNQADAPPGGYVAPQSIVGAGVQGLAGNDFAYDTVNGNRIGASRRGLGAVAK